MSQPRRAFTLIELLVVVAIIVILAGILFPVFAQAKGRARQVACASNLKQVSLAFIGYVGDYDGGWPYSNLPDSEANRAVEGAFNGWISNLLDPYAKSYEIYRCTADTLGGWFRQPQNQDRSISFCYNYRLMTTDAAGELRGVDEGTLSRASAGISSLAVLWDSVNSWNDALPNSSAGLNFRDLSWFRSDSETLTSWHQGNCNFLFADGHVKSSKWTQFVWQQVEPLADDRSNPNHGRNCVDGWIVE